MRPYNLRITSKQGIYNKKKSPEKDDHQEPGTEIPEPIHQKRDKLSRSIGWCDARTSINLIHLNSCKRKEIMQDHKFYVHSSEKKLLANQE